MKPTLVFERPGKVPFSDYRSTIALKKKAWGSVYGGWAPGQEKLRRKQRDRVSQDAAQFNLLRLASQ